MNSATRTTTTNTVRYIGRCKGCGCAARVDAEVESKRTVGAYGRTVFHVTIRFPHGETYRSDSSERAFFKCLCGARGHVEFKRIHGHVSTQACNAKCLASHGPVCECACGGKNHGASFAA